MKIARGLGALFLPKQDSLVRRLDTRIKLLWLFSIIILSLSIHSMFCLLLLFLSTAVYSVLAKAIKVHLLVARRLLFFAVLSLLLMLTVIRDTEYLMETVVQVVSKILIMSSAGILFALTTSPHELVGALDRLRVPRIMTFPLTIAMRFVPTLIREVREIADSLRLRGIDTGFRAVLRRPRVAYRGIFIPLTVRSIAISDELAAAAETRGFGGPLKRTSFREASMTRQDFIFLAALILFSVFIGLLDCVVRGCL